VKKRGKWEVTRSGKKALTKKRPRMSQESRTISEEMFASGRGAGLFCANWNDGTET